MIFSLVSSLLSAQDKNTFTIQGEVLDSLTEVTLVGVNIYLKNTKYGTVSDANGFYTLSVPEGSYLLIFSYVGYKQKEIEVILNRNLTFNVVLNPVETPIEEVQIIAQRKFFGNMEYGREISTIGAEVIEKQNVNNASDILHARLAGVWATKTSGAPGDHQKIRIRGQNSLFTSAEPLYVIDGVPVPIVNLSSLGIADLNIHDIDNVTVLKDASSTALYGFQGGNGVVLIDTKSGGKKEINFSTKFGYQWFDNFYDLMSAKEQFVSLDSANSKLGISIRSFYPEPSDTLCDHNRQKEIFSPGSVQDYQLSAGGSTGKIKYYLSGNYTDQLGILPYSEYKRYTLSARIGRTFWKRMVLNLAYRGSLQNNKDNQDQYKGNRLLFEGISRSPCLECTPDSLIYDPDVGYYKRIFYKYDPLNYDELPSEIADLYHHSLDITSHALNLSARYRLNDHLSFNVIGSMMYRQTVYNMTYKYFTYTYYRALPHEILLNSNEDVILINHQYSLSYNNTFKNHEVGGVIAYRNYKDNLWWEVDTVQGTLNNYSYLRNSMAAYGVDGSVLRSMPSYVANVSYSYRNKYFLSAVGNLSRIKEGIYIDYYTLFPSIAVSWDMAQEPVLRKISWLNNLKPYVNWGISGNYPLNGLANDLYQNVRYTHGSTDRETYPVILQFANHYLKHESTSELDFGITASLIKNRLHINAVHYIKNIDNLIIQRDIPLYYAGGKEYYNIGKIDVSGNEFGLIAIPIERKNFFWQLNFNIANSKQIIQKLYEERPLTFYDNDIMMPRFVIEQGKRLGDIYGYKCYGKWTQSDVDENNPLYIEYEGMKFLNADSSNLFLDENDMVVIGNSLPKITWNLSSNFQYKTFSLDIQWYAAWGIEKYNATRAATIMTAVNSQVNEYINDSITVLQRKFFYQSSEFIDNASFIRLKTITLSYEPSKAFLESVKLRVSVSLENILTITRYKGYDPEAIIFTDNNFSDNAIDRGAVPNPKTAYITIGLRF